MALAVESEIGRLEQVILHRPGDEMKRLTPQNKDDLLFDDILWLAEAQEEHDKFANVLRSRGVEVLYMQDLLAQSLDNSEARTHVLENTFTPATFGPLAVDNIRSHFSTLPSEELARILVAGLTKNELLENTSVPPSVVIAGMDGDDLILEPLVNHLFTRDTSCWIYNGVSINSMRLPARRRETVNYQAIYRWHPLFANEEFPVFNFGSMNGTGAVEGGDVLVIGNGAVLIGLGERSTTQGVEILASKLFASGKVNRIVALDMPKVRSQMHLDTVMTMINQGTFTKYAGMGMRPSLVITPGADPQHPAIVSHPAEDMHHVIARALGLADIEVLTTPQDSLAAAREQWDDANNCLTISPGTVVTYERNVATNTYLQSRGLEVLTVPGSELGRGRGGPRCMSCPTLRQPV